jgi:hypothetical protein
MFILSAIHRGFTARFWQFLFLVTFSGFIVHVTGIDSRLTALAADLRPGNYRDSECNTFHVNIANHNVYTAWGVGAITDHLNKLESTLETVNDTVSLHSTWLKSLVHRAVNAQTENDELRHAVRQWHEEALRQYEENTRQHEEIIQLHTEHDVKQTAAIENVINIVRKLQEEQRGYQASACLFAITRIVVATVYLYYRWRSSPGLFSPVLALIFMVFVGFDSYQAWYRMVIPIDPLLSDTQRLDRETVDYLKALVTLCVAFLMKCAYDWELARAQKVLDKLKDEKYKEKTSDTLEELAAGQREIRAELNRDRRSRSPPTLTPSQPASAGQVDSDSDSESLFAETNTTEGKVEPGRSVSPAPAVMLKDRLLSYTYDRNGLGARIAAL